jgi:hypothetical protein
MNYHPHMTLDVEDISRPATAIQRAFDYWHSLHPGRRGMTTEAAKRLLRILAPTLSIVRSVRQTLDEREEVLVQLTREQARILDFLDEQPHAAILGAAGTGKTLLAIEKARRLATPSETVLFLCYNSALCEHLRRYHAQPNVQYHTFHGFAREIVGPDGPLDTAEQSLIEQLAEDRPVPYQHLVVDEGQDFDRDWLEYLRYRFRDAAFYVFCDRFQAIQGEKDTRWIAEIPCRLVLTRNCRNTDPVAKVAYRAGGLGITPTLGVAGPQPTLHRVSGGTEAVALVGSVIEAACARHKMQPHEIAVLTLQALNDGGWSRVERLGGQLIADKPQPNHVTVTTVRRFKGLEAALIFVVDVDFARGTDDEWRRLLYVACSRARHPVHILRGDRESPNQLASFGPSSKRAPFEGKR